VGIAFSEAAQQRYLLVLFVINAAAFYLLLNGMLVRQNRFSYYRKKRVKRKLQ
jgi:hypothetical protein